LQQPIVAEEQSSEVRFTHDLDECRSKMQFLRERSTEPMLDHILSECGTEAYGISDNGGDASRPAAINQPIVAEGQMSEVRSTHDSENVVQT
jgi:hypothetical protein